MWMKQYVVVNIGVDARTTIKNLVKMLTAVCEGTIFLFLGMSVLANSYHWDVWFIVCTIMCCLVFRAIGVFLQTTLLNRFRSQPFQFRDQVRWWIDFDKNYSFLQIIMAYGGLRGAVAYGLVVSLPTTGFLAIPLETKKLFVTTIEIVVLFTVFVQVGSNTKMWPFKIFLHRGRQSSHW
jgi:NhaP-type Na+/H+ or K+/H+ antiporter